MDFGSRYPVILPREGHFAELIIDQCHKIVKHNGVKDTLTELRSNFWIVKGRQKIKGALRGKKPKIGELRRLRLKRTFISLSTFPDISPT